MSKYYTPEIEEFHVGFEYEFSYDELSNNKRIEKWISTIMEKYDDFDFVQNKIDTGSARVKHLDREDIESLEWVKDSGDCDYVKGKYQLEIYPTIYGEGLCLHITEDYGNFLLFHGTIKNKSELKRVLKQIL